MEKLIKTAVYSIPKLNLEEYCKTNNTSISDIYQALPNLEDEKLANLFLNRYPRKIKKENELSGENIIKQILNIKHLKLSELSETYQISKREILRKIKKVEQTNPELYEIYKRLRNRSLTQEDEQAIEKMPVEEIQTARRAYGLPKNISNKEHDSEKVFKTEEDIREEMYEKIAEKSEDPDEYERKINSSETEKLIQNRWKKEKVVIEIFEKECNKNLELLHITLGNEDTVQRIRKEFRRIDEEDEIKEIIEKTYEIK